MASETTPSATGQDRSRKQERSPSYPGIGLERALELTRTFYAQERKHAAPVNAALGHWGYAPKSGRGLVSIAAVIRFGLLTDKGSGENRTVQVTDLAYRIVVDEREESPERDQLIKQAALTPSIHRDVWTKYSGNLPSDQSMGFWLRTEKGFTEAAVREFIPQFRETVAFAKLSLSDRLPSDDNANKDKSDVVGDFLSSVFPVDPDAAKTPPPAAKGKTILWQQAAPLAAGLMAEVRIVGEAGTVVRLADLELLKDYLELGIKSKKAEETNS